MRSFINNRAFKYQKKSYNDTMKYNTIRTAYLALLALSTPLSISAEQPSPQQGLEARLENVRHGFWKGKYRVDGDLHVQSGGRSLPREATLVYSLCFEGYEPGRGIVINCVAGKNEFLPQGLPKGTEIQRRVTLQQKFAAPGAIERKKPKLSVSIFKVLGDDALYKKLFYLGEKQQYSCDKSCPD